jgi:predicted transcriptional regulator
VCHLILPCEVGVKTVLPAVKAVMARSIVEKHGLNEKQTAELLGLSQSAVSRYLGRERGNLLVIENTAEVLTLIDQMVTFLMKEPNNKTEILKLFCQTCTTIREKGLMCQHCQKGMTKHWPEPCFFCKDK